MTVTVHASGTKTMDIGTFTVTIASPAVFSKTNQLAAGDKVVFSTTGALPTGLTPGTTYYVIAAGLSGTEFQVSATDGGAAVNTSGGQSGTHSMVAEHFLTTTTTAATYTLDTDLNALAAGDVLEIRCYKMALAGGEPRPYIMSKFPDAQPPDDLIQTSIPVSTPLSDARAIRWSLKQTYGTARAVPYSVNKYA